MNKLITTTLFALVGVSLATSAFAANPPHLPPARPHAIHSHDLSCKVVGPNLIITNFGDTNADSGRQVDWSSPDTLDGGTLTLPKMLAPGEELRLADVLSDVPERFAPCDASFA